MLYRRAFSPVLLILIARAVTGQIGVSAQAYVPIDVVATSGAVNTVNSLPTGTLPASPLVLSAQTAGGATSSVFTMVTSTGPDVVTCSFRQELQVGGVGDSAACPHAEILLRLVSQTDIPVRLRVTYGDTTPAGAPQPRADIDVNDNGAFEYQNGVSTYESTIPAPQLMVRPGGLFLRVVLESQLSQIGATTSDLQIEILPDNDLSIDTTVIGCSAAELTATPRFAGSGVAFANASSTPLSAGILVLGIETMPVLIPMPPLLSTPIPCLLLPRADFVTVLSPLQPLVELPLPASVRPVTVWAQALEFNLRTTNALRVQAN